MVKKRLFLLVLLHVASILNNCQGTDADDGLADPVYYEDGYFDEDGNFFYYYPPKGYYDPDGYYIYYDVSPIDNVYYYDPPKGYYDADNVYIYFDAEGNENEVFVDENGNVFYYDPPKGYFNDDGYYYYFDEEYNYEDYTPEVIVVTRTVKYTKTTTTSEPMTCEEHPQIIEAKEMVLNEPMEGFTHDQCEFIIIDEFCAWEYRCGLTITEPPAEEEEEEEEEDYDYGDPEECETDKKVKFDNCFLKIRGLIKKKEPKRCKEEDDDDYDDDDDDEDEDGNDDDGYDPNSDNYYYDDDYYYDD